MEVTLTILIVLMIVGAIAALNAKDLLSAVIAVGIVGYGLVICFLLLKAPDLAIVQVVVETITLVIMIAVVLDSSRKEIQAKTTIFLEGKSYVSLKFLLNMALVTVFALTLLYFFAQATQTLAPFGAHVIRMATPYLTESATTGSSNLVTGVLFDFRGYDTLGEATVLFTAVIGVLTILRRKGKL